MLDTSKGKIMFQWSTIRAKRRTGEPHLPAANSVASILVEVKEGKQVVNERE